MSVDEVLATARDVEAAWRDTTASVDDRAQAFDQWESLVRAARGLVAPGLHHSLPTGNAELDAYATAGRKAATPLLLTRYSPPVAQR